MKKQFPKVLMIAAMSISVAALAYPHRHYHDGDAVADAALSGTTIGSSLGLSTAADCSDGYCKEDYRMAAAEAADYLAGGQMGPTLSAIVKANANLTEDQVIDQVLAIAEGL